MKTAIAAALLAAIPFTAAAWDVAEMNQQIDQTNFIVGGGCSGTLIDTDARLILTAAHCLDRHIRTVEKKVTDPETGEVKTIKVEKRDRVTVEQKDYRDFEHVGSLSYQTEIVGHRKERDVGLLQIVSETLRSVASAPILHKGDKVQRGEPVVSVGNPLGLDATVTSGVISSVNRTFEVSWANNERVPLIQFDASVNGGSSGGALYDSKGRLTGVVIASYSGSDHSFAVPVFEAYPMLDDICRAELYDSAADDLACEADDNDDG